MPMPPNPVRLVLVMGFRAALREADGTATTPQIRERADELAAATEPAIRALAEAGEARQVRDLLASHALFNRST